MNKRKDLETILIEKAWKDEEFKNELLNNTHAILENELDIRIPLGIKIKVMEESAEEVYLVLRQYPAKMSEQLTDAELDTLSGGTSVACNEPTVTNIQCW